MHRRLFRWRLAVAAAGALMLLALYFSLVYAPTERTMGQVQRVFYFHLGNAWNAFLAFFLVMVASIGYLKTRSRRWDIYAEALAEVGVVFTTVVLITGSIWGRAAWNTWWTWDPRLTTTLVLWFIYDGYLALRASLENWETRARLSAVYGIVGFVNVPIVFMSIRWWRTIHPVVISLSGMDMDPRMVPAMLASLLAFTLLLGVCTVLRAQISQSADALQSMKDAFRQD